MLNTLIANAGNYIHTSPWLALAAVFVGGILTASNPCVLAMIPLMISFIAGRRENVIGIRRAFFFSLIFVLGLSLTFTVLGLIAALAGQIYGDVSGAWNWAVALVCVVMGLHMVGVLTIPIPSLGSKLQPKSGGFFAAFLLGLLFGVVSAPCAAPILVILLTYLAGTGASLSWGATLLLVYALGHSVLIMLAGTSMGAARQLIENKKATRVLEVLRRCAGIVIVLIGGYFAYRGLQ